MNEMRISELALSGLQVVAHSQVNLLVQGKSEEAYQNQALMEADCQDTANELRKPVVLFLKRESGTKTFQPEKRRK